MLENMMVYKILKKYSKPVLYVFSVIIVLFISLYALFYLGFSFDGAFHSQAAINFYKSGKYVLDYPVGFTQIKVPFQLVNGFFLTLFGTNFIVANLANVLFYILFVCFSFMVHKQFNSTFILIGLILISFSSGVINYGFKGYGEFPVLVIGLFGLLLLTRHINSVSRVFIGGFLIGTAIATKWVFVLILVPFGLLLLIQLVNKKTKVVVSTISGFILSLLIFWYIEYVNYSVNLVELLSGIAKHSVPVNEHYYSSYLDRLSVFWHNYVISSDGVFLATLKIVAYFQLVFVSVVSLVRIIKSFKSKQIINSNQLFVFVISVFAIEYIVWWFFLGSKPWYRRGFVADILLIIALTLSVKDTFLKIKVQKIYNLVTFIIVGTLTFFSVFYFFTNKSNELFTIKGKGSVVLESHLRAGINTLPDGYIPFGYGWWQAPRWSFLSGSKHNDLFKLSVDDKKKIESGSNDYYVFFGPENFYDMDSYRQVHSLYKLTTVFEYKDYSIKQIVSKNDNTRTESFINYTDYDYNRTSGVYKRESDFCWYSQNAEVLLNSMNKNEFYLSYFIPDINRYPNPPFITVHFNNDLVYNKQIISSGEDFLEFKVKQKYKQNPLFVRVEVSSAIIAIGDSRNLGIPVRKIGFK